MCDKEISEIVSFFIDKFKIKKKKHSSIKLIKKQKRQQLCDAWSPERHMPWAALICLLRVAINKNNLISTAWRWIEKTHCKIKIN